MESESVGKEELATTPILAEFSINAIVFHGLRLVENCFPQTLRTLCALAEQKEKEIRQAVKRCLSAISQKVEPVNFDDELFPI